jgi:hypothetical protein
VQFVVTWLIAVTGNPMAPAWCIAAASSVAALATLLLPETGPRKAPLATFNKR